MAPAGQKNDQHPNWGGASRGQGAKTQARRWGKPKIGQNNLQNHYFARLAMDKENTTEPVNPCDEDNMEQAEMVNPAVGDEENMEEADMPPPDHAWCGDHALLHDPDDESHQDEEAHARNRDKFSGLLQDAMAKFAGQDDYQQEANALAAEGSSVQASDRLCAYERHPKRRITKFVDMFLHVPRVHLEARPFDSWFQTQVRQLLQSQQHWNSQEQPPASLGSWPA
jgi:hypothetical protein